MAYRNFTDEEAALLREFIFTNPNGNDGFVYPQPLVAGEELSPLMSAVSRTHVSMQDRTLDFIDKEKPEQARALMPQIRQLIDVFRMPDGTLRTSRRTTEFNREWVILHGHGSIKEGTMMFGHSEEISDIGVKLITGHPLAHPQVKSTRYISYKKKLDDALKDEDLASLPDVGRFLEHVDRLNKRYLEFQERIADAVFGHPYTEKVVEYLRRPEQVEAEVQKWAAGRRKIEENFEATPERLKAERQRVLKSLEQKGVRADIAKFALDYARVYLPAANRTSVVFSVDARTLEEIITSLISSPRSEDRARGYSIWTEAKKLAPVLLGERSHIKIDEWRLKAEQELREYCNGQFGHLPPRNRSDGTVNLLHPGNIEQYTDRFNAALIVFQYTDLALQDIMETLTEGQVREVLARAHQDRSDYDIIHPAVSHGGLMAELVMGYHGYRDMFRHRRGSRTTQRLTTRLGFETPEIFKVFGLDKEYQADMAEAANFYEEARVHSPYVAELLVPFGANCRALHSWQPNQMGYVGNLRGKAATGNIAYVDTTRELMRKVGELMPETAKQFRVDDKEYPAELWKKGYSWFDAEGRGGK